MKLSLLPLFLFAAISSAGPTAFAPQDKTLLVKESVATPHSWTRLGRAPSDHSIRLRIAILQQDFSGLEKALYEISDPDHHRYGAHMSKEEVEKFIAPNSTSLAFVDGWLVSYGLQERDLVRSPAKDWVSVTLPIHVAERMLGTEYYLWRHTSGDVLVRTASYKLPQYLHEHIELVQPTTMFTRPKGGVLHPEQGAPMASVKPITPLTKPHVDPSCAMGITLSCIMQLYNAVGYKPRAIKKNAIGITGFLNEYANIRDLASFYRDQLPAAVNSTFNAVSVYGGVNNQTSVAGEEANLDTQFAFGIAYPTPGTFWSTEGTPPFFPDSRTVIDTNEPYLDWLDYVLNSHQIPQTISTSYGDDEQTVPFTYARRVCQRFAELGCRGVSVLFASGDGGVGDGDSDPATQQCYTNDGKHTRRYFLFQPFSDVTAVGGTTSIPEISASFSGGGFSDYFERPAYQRKAVSAYLDKLPHRTYEGLFNRAGRGIPDVSAQSRKFQIIWQGERISIGGTSASTPAFAGLVALLNDARLAAGRPALGFLNPMLYKHGAHALNDIVVGSNPGCGTSGFNATKGWDPVTGLGTPDFRKLMEVVV
ncbi:tripeptidyl peptidase A [Mycena alexandri]|uniref:tripeptidyl-peptidase II n=1 Tax=Mycena alexandri TaxID=1745969 RepID=A0AAD6XA44_9AGAR|nr:tripeptidyl peptidase A [Mycena alexandri]